MKRSKKGKRLLDRRVRDYEETLAKHNAPMGAYTCPGRTKMK